MEARISLVGQAEGRPSTRYDRGWPLVGYALNYNGVATLIPIRCLTSPSPGFIWCR
jgi:hypothetical protein